MQENPTCPNCDAVAEGPYCSQCGQKQREPRGPLWGLFREFFGTVFNYDARFLKSLRILLIKPGQLTKLYLDGKRASLLPPVRLYLVLSLVLFLVIEIPVPDASRSNVYVGDQLVGREVADPTLKEISITTTSGIGSMPWLVESLEAKEEQLRRMDPQRLLDEIFRGLESSLSKALILFIPLLAFLLKILYIDQKRLYYDHVIFALHFQSFLFLLISISWCLSWIDPMAFLALLLTPIYLGLALRRVYQQGWLWTLPKLAVLLMSYIFILGTVLGVTFAYLVFRI
jgi:hypothetical protein